MDGANRAGLLILGLVLVVAGGLGLAAATGEFAVMQPSELAEGAGDVAAAEPWLWWSVVLLLAALLVLLGLRLAWRELAARPGIEADELTLDRGEMGTTRVDTRALERAAADDFARQDGVTGSRARLVQAGSVPVVSVRLDIEPEADLAAICQACEPVYTRLRSTLGVEDIHADMLLRPTGAPSRVE